MADCNLAEGTALALYIGHRESIDLDLFPVGKSLHTKIAPVTRPKNTPKGPKL